MVHSYQILILFFFSAVVFAHKKDEWRSRTIYQLLTDRFYRGNGNDAPCTDLRKYCGGTFKGIKEQISYIKNMGFDAIWISPIPENINDYSYHGYAFSNLYEINHHFGNAQDLKEMIDECHRQNIWVMLDVVPNHVAPVGMNFSLIYPFNRAEHYHDYCEVDWSKVWENRWMRENCRCFGLPDLKQENTWVRETLKSHIHNLVQQYQFDGLRLDTAAHVPVDFWREYNQAAGVFQFGEIIQSYSPIIKEYQGPIDSLLNYPLYDVVIGVFAFDKSMYNIRSKIMEINSNFPDSYALGNFVDNHDMKRFLAYKNDLTLYQNALTFNMFAQGIPIVYYGTEQGFSGGADPENREALWGHMNQSSSMYKFVRTLVDVRKRYATWKHEHVERYATDSFYAFTRGLVLVCTTNKRDTQYYTISYHGYHEGTRLCNAFNANDCVTVKNNAINVKMEDGKVKLYTVS